MKKIILLSILCGTIILGTVFYIVNNLQSFDDYIKAKGFTSVYDDVKSGNNACKLARQKGRECNDISFPENNYYYNSAKEQITYSKEKGVVYMGNVTEYFFVYQPLKNYFYLSNSDNSIALRYDTKNFECLKNRGQKCTKDEISTIKYYYEIKSKILDDFKGNLKNVEF